MEGNNHDYYKRNIQCYYYKKYDHIERFCYLKRQHLRGDDKSKNLPFGCQSIND